MRFTNKRKMNCIRKDDRVLDQVRPSVRVGYDGTGRHNSFLKGF